MKRITNYITEKLNLNKATQNNKQKQYNYYPKTRDELYFLIRQLIKERGNEANLNDIDISNVTNMSSMFAYSDFNGEISDWDVSNVTNMSFMFHSSGFNGDISDWNVSNVTNMEYMFKYSKFNGDISGWDVSNVKDMGSMFANSPLEKNPPKWYKI